MVFANGQIVLVDWGCAAKMGEESGWAGSVGTIDADTFSAMRSKKDVVRTAAIDLHCLLCTCLLLKLPVEFQYYVSVLTTSGNLRTLLGGLWETIFFFTKAKDAVQFASKGNYDELLAELEKLIAADYGFLQFWQL